MTRDNEHTQTEPATNFRRLAYDDFYHKIKAEISYDRWCSIWTFIMKRMQTNVIEIDAESISLDLLGELEKSLRRASDSAHYIKINPPAAPVAQEPVVFGRVSRISDTQAKIDLCGDPHITDGMAVYAAPVAAQAQPQRPNVTLGMIARAEDVLGRAQGPSFHRHIKDALEAALDVAQKDGQFAAQQPVSGADGLPRDDPEWLQRLRSEQRDLHDRQEKLEAFIARPAFRMLDEDSRSLLERQVNQQHVLLQTLNQRLNGGIERHRRSKNHD